MKKLLLLLLAAAGISLTAYAVYRRYAARPQPLRGTPDEWPPVPRNPAAATQAESRPREEAAPSVATATTAAADTTKSTNPVRTPAKRAAARTDSRRPAGRREEREPAEDSLADAPSASGPSSARRAQ